MKYTQNMHEICIKYAYNMQEIWQIWHKYARNMQEICKKYARKHPGNMLNMQKICMKYAWNMQTNTEKMHRNMHRNVQ